MPSIDRYNGYENHLTAPAEHLETIVPSDTENLAKVTRAIGCLTPGSVRVTTKSGDEGIVYLHPGAPLPIRVVRVWQTDTSATGIVGLS